MIKDFLKKYQEELISEKIQLKEDIDLLETKIREEKKFLALLEDSNESYFKEFTPRDINAKNNKKAEEIRNYLVELNSNYDKKLQKMNFFDGRLDEVNALISNKDIEQTPIIVKAPEIIQQDIDADESVISDSSVSNSELIACLSNIKDLILLDPYRAQIELEKIISSI